MCLRALSRSLGCVRSAPTRDVFEGALLVQASTLKGVADGQVTDVEDVGKHSAYVVDLEGSAVELLSLPAAPAPGHDS